MKMLRIELINQCFPSITTGGREKSSESRQIRNDGTELSEGERSKQIQDALPLRETSTEDARSGRGSEPVVRYTDGELPKEEQTRGSQFNHGDVEDKGTGEDAGRGNRSESDSNAFSLENASEVPLEEAQDNELNKELDEINSLGQSREAEYHQASFFDVSMEKTSASKFTYMQPKKELVVPHEYIVDVIKRGTGFEGGQKPLYLRLPKRGFYNRFGMNYVEINVGSLNCFEDGTVVEPVMLIEHGMIKNIRDGVRILGNGELTKKLTVQAMGFSKSAEEKIIAAGGKVEVI